ncbi:Protein of unknown function DUF4602 [Plasmopara halstedii]|uniref:Uncharacterized protein n=1 Tax=Plasmopara halstedii TaxID=4781 RepID=A0A0N7L4G2_PLAHL|nr:Protein of unknown function DUF4602 [Plasmopara halstedii]CEG38587.1 Protein of unknown function DUF4602 [Plasmopara halstedii]|eukprot:XP_024574956.1 Protein of unknown function DUF4602 [Plasmopara halstedii]
MWTPESRLRDDDPREIQRQREAYARELDHQIALRRARQHQEQLEREELERKLAPSDRSPSKWLVEGGQLDLPTISRTPWKFTQSTKYHENQQQDRGAATGEANSLSSSHPRFRVIDESETSQRVRERAQQMRWKQILDDQVQEKERFKKQEEAERRRSEEEAAKEEVRYLRQQQLQAQRRLGKFSPAFGTASIEDLTEENAIHHAFRPETSLNGPEINIQPSKNNNPPYNNDSKEEADSPDLYLRNGQFDKPNLLDPRQPPPAPSRFQMPNDDALSSSRNEKRNSFGQGWPNNLAVRQAYPSAAETQASYQHLDQQSHMIEEYRSLLAEIRREREELRRERDEVRHEKEDLRVQRALLQLENEKMASLVDAQRALYEQQQDDLQIHQAQQLAQQEAQRTAKQHASYQYTSLQYQDSSVQPAGLQRNNASGESEIATDRDRFSNNVAYAQLNQICQSLGTLNIDDDQPSIPGRRRKPLAPMSMAEFSALTPQKWIDNNLIDTPQFQRLSQYQPNPAVLADDESLLNQSLVGDSVFVPLSPQLKEQGNKGPLPRTTSSPTSADRQRTNQRAHPLRSSRVIKSRGFYDFEQFPVATGKKKVQVFECPTETWKECKPFTARKKGNENEPEMTMREEIRKEFDETFASVLDFASSSLKGKDKKKHEAKKIEALGGKAAKNRSVPYKILVGLRTKGFASKQRREKLLKESDVVTGKRKSSVRSIDQQKRKKVDYGVQATKGRFKGGVLDKCKLLSIPKEEHFNKHHFRIHDIKGDMTVTQPHLKLVSCVFVGKTLQRIFILAGRLKILCDLSLLYADQRAIVCHAAEADPTESLSKSYERKVNHSFFCYGSK